MYLQLEMEQAVSNTCPATTSTLWSYPTATGSAGSFEKERSMAAERRNLILKFSSLKGIYWKKTDLLGKNMTMLGFHYKEHVEVDSFQHKQL